MGLISIVVTHETNLTSSENTSATQHMGYCVANLHPSTHNFLEYTLGETHRRRNTLPLEEVKLVM